MKVFEAIFIDKNGKEVPLTIQQPNIKNRLDAYNYICTYKLGLVLGELIQIREKPQFGKNMLN